MALKDVTEKIQVEQQAALGETAFFTARTAENTGETNKLFAAFFKQLAVEAGDRKEEMNELKKAMGKGGSGGDEKSKVKEAVKDPKKALFAGLAIGNFIESIGLSALIASLPAIGKFVKSIGKATPTYIFGNLVFKTMLKSVKALPKALNLYLKPFKALGNALGNTKFFKGARISALAIELIVKDMFKSIFPKVKPINLSGIKGFGTFLKNIVLKPFEIVSDAIKVSRAGTGVGLQAVLSKGQMLDNAMAGRTSMMTGGKLGGQRKATSALATVFKTLRNSFKAVKDAVAKFFKPLTSLFGGGSGKEQGKIVKAIGNFLKGFGTFAGKILKFIPIIGWIFVAFDAIKGFFAGFAKYKDEGFLMGAIGALFGSIEQVLVGAIGIPFDLITKAISWLLSKIPGGKFLSDKIDSFLEGGGFVGLIRGFFGGLMDMIGNFFASFFSGFENGIISGLSTAMLKMAKFVKKLYSFPIALVAGGVSALAHILGDPKAAFQKTFKKVMNAGDSKIDSAIVAVGGKTKEQAVADRAKLKEKTRKDKELKEAKEAAAKLEAQKKEEQRLANLNKGASNSNAPVTIINAPDNSSNIVGGSGGGGSSAPIHAPSSARDLNDQIKMFKIVTNSFGYG